MTGKMILRPGTPDDDNREYLPEKIKGSDIVVNENGNNSQPYPERLKECHEKMKVTAGNLLQLVNNVLDMNKLETSRLEVEYKPFDIREVLRGCWTDLESQAEKMGLELEKSGVSEIECPHVVGSPMYFRQIFANILSNAVKYNKQKGNLNIHSYLVDQDYIIEVSDTGRGISLIDQGRVFERFFRCDAGRDKETGGTGLGLAIVKHIVQYYKGTIHLESELGKGSTFTVDLPINKDSYQEDELISEHISVNGINTDLILEKEELIDSKVGEGEDAQIADVHLLLVEDNEELLFLMEKILSKHYHVLIAKDGLEALNVIKDNEIDIIISDVMMPEMDGLEFCRALKSNLETSHIPIILLTAKNTVEDRIECYNAGADGYISKPFELKILEARINNFIMHKKNKQEEFRSNVEVNIDSLEPSSIDKEFLDKVISVINSNMSEGDFDVVQLADALAVSKSSLYRKMKIATGLSPIEFIRNIRLKHGSQLLKDKSISVAEVAYECGFSNPKYFATCFKEEFGVTPKEYQKSC